MATGIFNTVPLNGETSEKERPTLSLQDFMAGKYQDTLQSWFEDKLGFRGELVKSENQLNLDVFGEIASESERKIVLGKNGHLYEKFYIDDWNGYYLQDKHYAELNNKVQQLKKLQLALEERGKKLLILLSPSKATVYPEFIPEKYIRPDRADRTNRHQEIVPLLESNAVSFFDATAFLIKVKEESELPLFAKGGTHWNYYAACLVSAEVARTLSLSPMSCDPVTFSTQPRGSDNDLKELINVWRADFTEEAIPYPTIQSTPKSPEKRQRVLMVGDSFAWALLDTMDEANLFERIDFFYYFKRLTIFPRVGADEPVERESLDWEKLFEEHDIFIIESMPAALGELGYEFIEEALKNLKPES